LGITALYAEADEEMRRLEQHLRAHRRGHQPPCLVRARRDPDRRLDVRATGMLEESDQIPVLAGFRFSNVCPVAEEIQRPSM
jgi:hypothetical protein